MSCKGSDRRQTGYRPKTLNPKTESWEYAKFGTENKKTECQGVEKYFTAYEMSLKVENQHKDMQDLKKEKE